MLKRFKGISTTAILFAVVLFGFTSTAQAAVYWCSSVGTFSKGGSDCHVVECVHEDQKAGTYVDGYSTIWCFAS